MNKQHILDEIKRTASANGGVPLGQARFFNETGIKITDWRGRFWARWGDAVKEAGFEPNALQTAYGETELIKHLLPLIRELNRFPVHTELRMKALDDVTFPSHTVWWTRFGSKQNLTKRVIEYCSTDPDLEDVAVICGSIANAVETRQAQRPEKEEPSFGFVYLLRSGRYYKIGRSNAAGRRERELQIQLPEKAQTVHVIRTDDPGGIEAYWYNRFVAGRKNGEWFELTAADIAAFRRRKFM